MKNFKTIGQITKELRLMLVYPRTRIQYRRLKNYEASSTFFHPGKGITIIIGAGKCGRIRAVVHELLHQLFNSRMRGLGYGVVEPQIRSLEEEVVKNIFNSDKQVLWWIEHITRKLPKKQKTTG
jgi:hypothetical protein